MKLKNNFNIDNNNIMNKTFNAHHKQNYFIDNDYQQNSQMINNNDVRAQTLSLFGINPNNILDTNNISINNGRILKNPKFELEPIYRERLFNLYKNKSKEELLNCFIESEINNILLRKEIEKDKLNKVKLENKIIDLNQENIVLKTKMKNLSQINDDIKFNKESNIVKDENNLSLPNSSFVQKELNIKNEFNNMDIDALLINENNKF